MNMKISVLTLTMLGVLTACTNSYASEVKKQTIESKETLAAVGHRPKLNIGLQINGGDNIIQQDPDTGVISIKSPKPVITENDILKYHGIYSDIDGDTETTNYQFGSSLRLDVLCPGKPLKHIGGEFVENRRSKAEFDFETDLSKHTDLVGCELFINKLYGESANKQTSANNITYTPNPRKSLETSANSFELSLGKITAAAKPFGVKGDVIVLGPNDMHPSSIQWQKKERLHSAYKVMGNEEPAKWKIEVEGGTPGYTFSINKIGNENVAEIESTSGANQEVAIIKLTGNLGKFNLIMRDSAGNTLEQEYEIKYSGFFTTQRYDVSNMNTLAKLNDVCRAIDNNSTASPGGSYAYDFISMWGFKAMRALNINDALGGRGTDTRAWIFSADSSKGETHWPETGQQYRLVSSADSGNQLPVMCTIR
ncbi:hypothetical protein ABUU05_24235 [Escherichia coli]|uniref:hypothetical protein n=1 Tax=Escherichia coli TaxID=562 RepID=UPI00335FC885